MRRKNKEKRLEKVYTDEEREVALANLKSYNYCGRVWLLGRARVNSPQIVRLMKVRALTYRKVCLEIASSINKLKEKNVLDVGCGTSEYQEWLAENCARLFGVDISVEMLRLCRHDKGKSIELIAADAMHLPFKDGAFDLTTIFQSLHHVPNWQKALKEMVRTSKQVSLYEPNGDSIFHRLMHLIRGREKRFKQTNEDYNLVEYQASGFSPTMITCFLKRKSMITCTYMSDILPVSLLEKLSRRSPRVLFIVFTAEDFIRKIPILRNQLGNMLIIGSLV